MQIRGMEIVEENGHTAVVDMRESLTSYESLVNVDDLTTEKRIYGQITSTKHWPSIFQIPSTLYRSNKKAYLPKAFSFGPWHYRKPDLEATQAIKFSSLQHLLSGFPNATTKLAELETAVSERQLEARACYAKQVNLDDELFVQILVLDGCFIVELLREVSMMLMTPYFLQCLYHDLILLENQIPWFVLELLFDLTNKGNNTTMLSQLAVRFFSRMFSGEGLPIEISLLKTETVDHILDLLRKCLFLSFLRDTETEKSRFERLRKLLSRRPNAVRRLQNAVCRPLIEVYFLLSVGCCFLLPLRKLISRAPRPTALEPQLPSASRLREAGIKFKRGQSRPILDIRFRGGVLQVPPLLIHDTTETIFRNLIALEQCNYLNHGDRDIVASYAKLMDNLIDTVEDIDILCKNGIICNSLNPEDAAQFFNRLCSDTHISHPRYHDIYWGVNDYCQRWWPRWRAFYIHNYFAKPWAIFSQIFALLILGLTILQLLVKK